MNFARRLGVEQRLLLHLHLEVLRLELADGLLLRRPLEHVGVLRRAARAAAPTPPRCPAPPATSATLAALAASLSGNDRRAAQIRRFLVQRHARRLLAGQRRRARRRSRRARRPRPSACPPPAASRYSPARRARTGRGWMPPTMKRGSGGRWRPRGRAERLAPPCATDSSRVPGRGVEAVPHDQPARRVQPQARLDAGRRRRRAPAHPSASTVERRTPAPRLAAVACFCCISLRNVSIAVLTSVPFARAIASGYKTAVTSSAPGRAHLQRQHASRAPALRPRRSARRRCPRDTASRARPCFPRPASPGRAS